MEKKNSKLSYILCIILTALVVFAGTMVACTFLFVQQKEVTPAPQQGSAGTTIEEPYLQKTQEVIDLLEEMYVDDVNYEVLDDYLAEAAVAATGDKWSYYISAEDFAAYAEDSANAYVGIGITIELSNEDDAGFTVIQVARNGPAEAAGIRVGDMLTKVEGQNVMEIGMTEARNLVRGKEGTDVTITILRDGKERDFTITRATVEVEVVTFELLESNIGYIKINNFGSNCARDTLEAIETLLKQGAKSLIFDLRFNSGGLKSEMIEVLDYLLPEGPLFRSVDYLGNESVDYSDARCLDVPMAVIVNQDSYSAAEFFAAALQEYDAAVVVGTQTTGKANYQQTFMLSDGSAVAVSTGHYQTPNGVTLTDIGVTPDEIVEVDEETYLAIYYETLEKADDLQLQRAISAVKR